ncbi:hypothetical protein ECFRIK1997_1067, partial [Escherichia coli FRIK1997]
TWENIGGMK